MPSRSSRLRALLLALDYPHRASYYDDWRDAFCQSPDFDCSVDNILRLQPSALARKIDEFDAVILLHSCNSDTLDYFAPLASALAGRKRAKLLSFVGNEFNWPYVSLVEKVRLFRESRCDVVATQLLQEAGQYFYAGCNARIISVPHALNPRVFVPGPAHARRRLDLGVKGYRYPPYLGDDDRNRLLDHVRDNAAALSVAVDITYDQRLSREDWVAFLSDCRGTISTETGSWYLDPTDTLIREIYDYMAARRTGLVLKNESLLRRAARRLPASVKAGLWTLLKHGPVKFEVLDDFNVPFAEMEAIFFAGRPHAPVYGKAISSRHFDAVGTKTCQVMLRGRFNDILKANEHYIAIDPAFDDVLEAMRRFKDAGERQAMVDRTYDYVLASHTHAHRAAEVRKVLESV